jgi:hypothetical protein
MLFSETQKGQMAQNYSMQGTQINLTLVSLLPKKIKSIIVIKNRTYAKTFSLI